MEPGVSLSWACLSLHAHLADLSMIRVLSNERSAPPNTMAPIMRVNILSVAWQKGQTLF